MSQNRPVNRPAQPRSQTSQQQATLISESNADFIDVSIAEAMQQHRRRSRVVHFPRERYYLEVKREDGETRFYEVLSVYYNEYDRYTIKTQRGKYTMTESVDASTLLKELNYADFDESENERRYEQRIREQELRSLNSCACGNALSYPDDSLCLDCQDKQDY